MHIWTCSWDDLSLIFRTFSLAHTEEPLGASLGWLVLTYTQPCVSTIHFFLSILYDFLHRPSCLWIRTILTFPIFSFLIKWAAALSITLNESGDSHFELRGSNLALFRFWSKSIQNCSMKYIRYLLFVHAFYHTEKVCKFFLFLGIESFYHENELNFIKCSFSAFIMTNISFLSFLFDWKHDFWVFSNLLFLGWTSCSHHISSFSIMFDIFTNINFL